MIGTIFNNSQNQHNVIIENVLLKLINQLKICYSVRFITSGWHIKGKDFLNTEQGGKMNTWRQVQMQDAWTIFEHHAAAVAMLVISSMINHWEMHKQKFDMI